MRTAAFFASLKPRSIKATTIGGTIVRKRAQAPRSASCRVLDPVEKACPLTFAAGRTIRRQSRGGLRVAPLHSVTAVTECYRPAQRNSPGRQVGRPGPRVKGLTGSGICPGNVHHLLRQLNMRAPPNGLAPARATTLPPNTFENSTWDFANACMVGDASKRLEEIRREREAAAAER